MSDPRATGADRTATNGGGRDCFAPGEHVMIRTSEGEELAGVIQARIVVGDLQSFDVTVGGGEPLIVPSSRILGHPDYQEHTEYRRAS